MRSGVNWLFCVYGVLLALSVNADPRKIRVRPQEADVEEQNVAAARSPRIQYYAAEDPEEQQQVVLVSTDEYNGLYGRPQARVIQDNYIPQSRHAPAPVPQSAKNIQQRIKETPKAPPVQTIRNYNKVNDDGSFTFGYEAADGSFKEETRGTDCVVRGKYGYIDPDGNKREFTYVSGNPCDPNAPQEDSDERRDSKGRQEEDEDDGVANYPKQFQVRPTAARPTPAPTRAPVTVFQNVFSTEEEEDEPEPPLQVLRPQTPRTRPVIQPRPTFSYFEPQPQPQPQPERRPPTFQLQHIQPTTPNSVIYQSPVTPVTITPRPTTVKAKLPATTYRPQLVAVTPRPQSLFTKEIETQPPAVRFYPSSTPAPITRTPGGSIDFAAELQKFAQEHNVVSSTPKTLAKTTEKIKPTPFQANPIYSSELVFDPSSGQYKTQLYQTLPQTTGDFTLSHRIQPFVTPIHAQPPRLIGLPELQQASLYRPVQHLSPQPQPRPQPSQQLYHQQQAELQFQNSQQLYAQQQRARAAAAAQRAAPAPAPAPIQTTSHAPQQFYFIQPGPINTNHQSLASGQIEAFLRGHNINLK